MFKINIYLKFALIALCLVGGVVLTVMFGFWYAFIFLLVGLGLLASYFLLGTVQSAAEFIQLQDFVGAEQRLNLTFFPKLLYVTNRAIFYLLKGSIEMSKQNTKMAESYFNTALELELPSDNEKAMVILQLANINAQRNNWTGAKVQFAQVKKLKITEPMIKEQIDYFEKAINSRGQAGAARSMGKQGMQMMQQGMGGKRRRPKMR